MSTVIPYLLTFLLCVVVAAGWGLTLVGLPGNWLMLLAASGYAYWGPQQGILQLSWTAVAAIGACCVVGEIAEQVAGMWGARRAGGSRRAAVFSLIGSLAGAIGGGILGLPIPVLGTAVAAVVGGAVGALVGAALAEKTLGESHSQSLRVGHAAFWGRLLGVGIKTFLATVIATVIVVGLCV